MDIYEEDTKMCDFMTSDFDHFQYSPLFNDHLTDLPRQRNELSVELRKMKKVDNLSKIRNLVEDSDEENVENEEPTKIITPDDPLEDLLNGISQTEDLQLSIKCTKAIRRMLSRVKTPPINTVLEYGFGPYLVKYLSMDSCPQLQFESTWALTNITSGDSTQTRAVVKLGAVPHFIRLLSSQHRNVAEQAVWALGNIAGDGSDLRDCVIRAGCITPILKLIEINTKAGYVNFVRNLTWTVSNLCRNKNPSPDIASIKRIVPTLKSLLIYDDDDVKGEACWAISYITDGSYDKIDLILDSGIVPMLLCILNNNMESKLLAPAIRSVGNIVTGSDENTQFVMDCGILKTLKRLLGHPKNTIQKETAWTLSNILAGTLDQIREVINCDILPIVVAMTNNCDPKTQKEIAWIYSNISTGGSNVHMYKLMEFGCIAEMSKLLLVKDTKLIVIVLETITNMLKIAKPKEDREYVEDLLEETGCLDAIEALQDHKCDQIYTLVSNILEKYFIKSDNEENDGEVEFVDVLPRINQQTGQFEILTVEEIEKKNFEFNF